MGKPVDNPGTPTLRSLLGEDIPSYRPIEENQLAIDRERSSYLGGPDASFELLEEFVVAGGQLEAPSCIEELKANKRRRNTQPLHAAPCPCVTAYANVVLSR
ncbi:MAG: hypothetical protein QOE55_4818, partial [Acidobacteriaceae bacterium]|nr:hypothetical protein [Acidobacteriaceae bacterium]